MHTILVTAKPIRAKATQWHQHGDHPRVTRAHKNPNLGWIWTELGGECVVPGSWIVEHHNQYRVVLEPDFEKLWHADQTTTLDLDSVIRQQQWHAELV